MSEDRYDSQSASLDQRRHIVEQQRDGCLSREARWSWSRLAIFVATVLVWVFLSTQPALALGLTAIAVSAFYVAVRTHQSARRKRESADRLLTMIDEAAQRQGGAVACVRAWERPEDAPIDAALPFVEARAAIWPLTAQERDDLDLFSSPVGVFGLLNRTSSAVGARRVRHFLENPLLDPKRILERQASVHWLAEHPDQRFRVMAALARLRGEDRRLAALIKAIRDARPLKLIVSAWALRTWSVLTTAATVLALTFVFGGEWIWNWLLGAVLVLNGALYARLAPMLSEVLTPWHDVAWAAQGYQTAAEQAAQDLPDDARLGAMKQSCARVGQRDALPRLTRRVGWAESGGMMHLLMNVIALNDVHVALAILKPAVNHRDGLLAGVAALAELEALCSLACFSAEQPLRCFPTPVDQTQIEIVAGTHPLIDPDAVVPNDVTLDRQTRMWIVTGSNMAGKSTLLRMVSVNVLLAQIGCAVTARQMRWRPLRLITDLRARDDLAHRESYFLSEVRHLRRMVASSDGAAPLLGVIDEPFRGTNSLDQSAASVAVVRHLLESDNLFLLATHDGHLTELADGARARNFHFRENLEAGGMVFDYCLHDGPAVTRNALRILEAEGYPAEIVRWANEWLGDAGNARLHAPQAPRP